MVIEAEERNLRVTNTKNKLQINERIDTVGAKAKI